MHGQHDVAHQTPGTNLKRTSDVTYGSGVHRQLDPLMGNRFGPQPITPNLLLKQKGSDLNTTRPFDEDNLLSYGPRRWKKVQALADILWKEWRNLYLLEQQKRAKWTKHVPPL